MNGFIDMGSSNVDEIAYENGKKYIEEHKSEGSILPSDLISK